MNEPNLLVMCLSAFAAVLAMLSLLALAMRLLIVVFPPRVDAGALAEAVPVGLDPAVAAAIATAVHNALPGGRVVRIEEIKRGRQE